LTSYGRLASNRPTTQPFPTHPKQIRPFSRQRRCLKRRILTASAPTVFYAVRLGHVPGIYTSWREAKPHTIGILSDVKRFSTRKKAEEYISKSTGPRDPLLDNPSAFLFTDGSALPNGSAGWGVHITFPGTSETSAIWGPVSTSPTGRDWLGARRATSNTGKLSAFYHALDWIRKRRDSLDPASSPRYNLVSDSFYCVKLFATRAIKPVANKHIIARSNALLDQMKRDNSITISWTPAHANSDDPLAQGNAEADKLAARGRAGPHLLTQFRPPVLALRSSVSAVPLPSRPRSRRRSEVPLARGRSERPLIPLRNPRLPRFDFRQPVSWRANFSFSHSSCTPCL